jgi:hypothetical protein
MKDFEAFRKSRERMDPAARKMTDYQWEQAYAAYCRTREKRPGRGSDAGDGSSRRRSSREAEPENRPPDAPGATHRLVGLRAHIRSQSAYFDLRVMVNVLAWVAIGLVVLNGLIRGFMSAAGGGSVGSALMLSAFLRTGLQVLVVLVLRLLSHVLIDMADIALHRAQGENDRKPREAEAKKDGSGEVPG